MSEPTANVKFDHKFSDKNTMLYNFRKNRNRYDNLLIDNRDRSSIDVQI